MSTPNNTFNVGLCMAGAVSAGAYTAGVMDYLIEALEEWEKRKKSGDPNVPSHNVIIPVMGGASAGGMTAIMAASAIQETIEPVREYHHGIKPKNKFYNSWVNLTSDDMMSALLETSDIKKGNVESALNAEFIDEIAKTVVEISPDEPVKRNFFSENLKVFVTLSNLEGMNYDIKFQGNNEKSDRYIITSHNDYACFKLCDCYDEKNKDGWIPLNFKTRLNVEDAKDAAMATGAFPIGLKAREVFRNVGYMNDLDWYKHITAQEKFKSNLPEPSLLYRTLNVDGGMINNEPFELVKKVLLEKPLLNKLQDINSLQEKEDIKKDMDSIIRSVEKEQQNYKNFTNTVLMIDPFPSKPEKFKGTSHITSVIGNTLSAIMNQTRVKPAILNDAINSDKAGQYLISPARYENEKTIEGSDAIACGSLGGFGGFISKEFRIHDYFLGRANCEKFLRDHFTVRENAKNEIFENGYANVLNKEKFRSKTDKEPSLQIIPIFTKIKKEPYLPVFSNGKKWPTVSEKEIHSYKPKIRKRIKKLIFNIVDLTFLQKLFLWVAFEFLIGYKMTKSVISTITKALDKHTSLEKDMAVTLEK